MRGPVVAATLCLLAPLAWAGDDGARPQIVDPTDDVVLMPVTGNVVMVAHPAIDIVSVAWGAHNATHGKVEWRVKDLGQRLPLDSLAFYMSYAGGDACPWGKVDAHANRLMDDFFTSFCHAPPDLHGGTFEDVEGRFDVAAGAVTAYLPLARMPERVGPGAAGGILAIQSTAGQSWDPYRDYAPEVPGAVRIR